MQTFKLCISNNNTYIIYMLSYSFTRSFLVDPQPPKSIPKFTDPDIIFAQRIITAQTDHTQLNI